MSSPDQFQEFHAQQAADSTTEFVKLQMFNHHLPLLNANQAQFSKVTDAQLKSSDQPSQELHAQLEANLSMEFVKLELFNHQS
jgi:hypothetical protein